MKKLIMVSLVVVHLAAFCVELPAQQLITKGKGSFHFNYAPLKDKPIPVWYYSPVEDPSKLPIVIVMHGVGRNADGYRDSWVAVADSAKVLIITPEFSQESFPGARSYNLGNMFTKDGAAVKEDLWSFSVIEPLFDHIRKSINSNETGYTLYGHSAGSQFVHRFAMFKPDNRANKIITANAGWYTMPDFTIEFPYGLKSSGCTDAMLKKALSRNIVVLLGDQDTDPNHKHLRRTEEAMAQGPHRLARGRAFFARANEAADSLGVFFNWKLEYVKGANHSNAKMAKGVIPFL